MVHFQQKSDSDGNHPYMCYHLTLYNVQCQDNINIVYNHNLIYKILINKSIIKTTYVTTSMTILPAIVWFNNTVVIQCTVYIVYTDNWIQCILAQYNQEWGRSLCFMIYHTRVCMPPCFCGQASTCLLSCVLQHLDTCGTPVRLGYIIHSRIHVVT